MGRGRLFWPLVIPIVAPGAATMGDTPRNRSTRASEGDALKGVIGVGESQGGRRGIEGLGGALPPSAAAKEERWDPRAGGRRGGAGRRRWAGGGWLAVGLAMGLAAFMAGVGEAQVVCSPGTSPGTHSLSGSCVKCMPGWGSNGKEGCKQFVVGFMKNRLETANFALWQTFKMSEGDILSVKLSAKFVFGVPDLTVYLNQSSIMKPRLMADEEWGLPSRAAFCGGEVSAQSECKDGAANETFGMLTFAPSAQQIGDTYSMCAVATIALKSDWALQPLKLCIKAQVQTISLSSLLPCSTLMFHQGHPSIAASSARAPLAMPAPSYCRERSPFLTCCLLTPSHLSQISSLTTILPSSLPPLLLAPSLTPPSLRPQVVAVTPLFTNSSNDTQYHTINESFAFAAPVGCPLEIPLEITPTECAVSPTDCAVSRASSPGECSDVCGRDVSLAPAVVGPQPHGSVLARKVLTPGGLQHTAQHRPQFWALKWTPEHTQQSQIPYSVCMTPGPGGQQRCWRLFVEKCSHCVRPGDSMESIAAEHGAGWLQLYMANPRLPSHNPQAVAREYALRLGVVYEPRAGDSLEFVAQKFLVSTDAILSENFELWAPARMHYDPRAPGVSARATIIFNATRGLKGGDVVTVTVPELSGPDWIGMTAPDCSVTESLLHYGRFPALHIKHCTAESHPGNECGPGGWGECQYDADGKPACSVYQCKGYGAHPKMGAAKWSGGTKRLMIEVRQGAMIKVRETVSVVVPRTAGMMYPPRGHPADQTRAVFPLP